MLAPGFPLRKYAGPLHQSLALKKLGLEQVGWWLVVTATVLAVVLELGGLVLWWKRKSLRVRIKRGWRQALIDAHHLAGIIGFPIMFLLSLTGVGMAFLTRRAHPELRNVVFNLHTAKDLPLPLKLLFAVATTGFLVQGVTGLVMWWKPSSLSRE